MVRPCSRWLSPDPFLRNFNSPVFHNKFWNDSEVGTSIGPLNYLLAFAPTAPNARVIYPASWIDGVGRTFASADYGTNGRAAFTRSAAGPARSNNILAKSTSYNDDGEVFSTLNPQNTKAQFEFDDIVVQIPSASSQQNTASRSFRGTIANA